MPKNEPVKLVYPTNNNTQTSTIVTMNNNRVTFSSAPVQNGTITLSPMNQMTQQGQQQQTVNMQGNIKITNQSGQQAPTLIFKNANSSAPGTFVTSSPVTMSKTNNQVRYSDSSSSSDGRVLCEKKKTATAMTEIFVFLLLHRCVCFFIGAKLQHNDYAFDLSQFSFLIVVDEDEMFNLIILAF